MISIAGFYLFFFWDTGDSGCFFINLMVGLLATIGHHVSGPASSSIFSLSVIVSIFPATAAATEAIFFTIFFCGPKNLVSLFPLSSSSYSLFFFFWLASFFFYRFISASRTLVTGNLFFLYGSLRGGFGDMKGICNERQKTNLKKKK